MCTTCDINFWWHVCYHKLTNVPSEPCSNKGRNVTHICSSMLKHWRFTASHCAYFQPLTLHTAHLQLSMADLLPPDTITRQSINCHTRVIQSFAHYNCTGAQRLHPAVIDWLPRLSCHKVVQAWLRFETATPQIILVKTYSYRRLRYSNFIRLDHCSMPLNTGQVNFNFTG